MYLKGLRLLCLIEGVSTLILFFIAMPLKYMADMPMAVTVAGSIHGLLFTLMFFGLYWAVINIPIKKEVFIKGVLAAVIPFAPFFFDKTLKNLEA